jgi:hypothetical protein
MLGFAPIPVKGQNQAGGRLLVIVSGKMQAILPFQAIDDELQHLGFSRNRRRCFSASGAGPGHRGGLLPAQDPHGDRHQRRHDR